MRTSTNICSPLILLLHLLAWLLVTSSPALALSDGELEAAQRLIPFSSDSPLNRLTRQVTSGRVRKAVKNAPEALNLRNDNFLGSGFKRKSVAGAYGSSAAVTVGAAAIAYQTINFRSKNRIAEKKLQSKFASWLLEHRRDWKADMKRFLGCKEDASVREAICAEKRMREASSGMQSPNKTASRPSPPQQETSRWSNIYATVRKSLNAGRAYAYPPSRAVLTKRTPISDATLTTIEDYNKLIGGTEALISGSIALASA